MSTQYVVGHYDASLVAVMLPVMVRGEYVCNSLAEAYEQCLRSATADMLKDTRLIKTQTELPLDPLPEKVSAGFHARWIKTLDDYPTDDSTTPTHRTLGLYYARLKQRWFIGADYAGTSRPVRYYFVTPVQNTGDKRADHGEDEATLRSSDSSDEEDQEKEKEEEPQMVCPVKGCTRGTVHFHARRRPRPR